MVIKTKNNIKFKRLLSQISISLNNGVYEKTYVDLDDEKDVENVKNLYLNRILGVDLNSFNTLKFDSLIHSIYPKIIDRAILFSIIAEAFGKSSVFMTINDQFIEQNQEINDGRPSIKGTRISVGLILEKLAAGDSVQDIMDAYPHLSKEQIEASINYGAKIANDQNIFVKAIE